MSHGICQSFVKADSRKGYGRRLKVYKTAAAAKRAGARKCGGKTSLVLSHETVYRSLSGMGDEWQACSDLTGWDVVCQRCGTVALHISLDEAESILAERMFVEEH